MYYQCGHISRSWLIFKNIILFYIKKKCRLYNSPIPFHKDLMDITSQSNLQFTFASYNEWMLQVCCNKLHGCYSKGWRRSTQSLWSMLKSMAMETGVQFQRKRVKQLLLSILFSHQIYLWVFFVFEWFEFSYFNLCYIPGCI